MRVRYRQPGRRSPRLMMQLLLFGFTMTFAQLNAQEASGGEQQKLLAATRAMRAGVAAASRNDLVMAHREFARAVALAPEAAATHAALGSVLLAQGEPGTARKELERAHTMAPSDVGVTLNLARAQSLLDHFGEAVALFRTALELAPPPVLSEEESLAYAAALTHAGDPKQAESLLAEAAARSPDSALLHDALGTVYARTDRLPEARARFERALALDAGLWEAEVHLGATLLAMGDAAEAVVPLRRAATEQPSSFEAHLQLGRVFSALHQDGAALAELHHAVALQPNPLTPASSYELALALQASGDAAGSLPLFQRALEGGAPGSDVLVNCALAHVQTGDAAGALPFFARALAAGPDTAPLRENYGVAFLQQADLRRAIEQFRAGLTLDPDSANLHYDLGLAYKLQDDLENAIPELERSTTLDSQLAAPAYTLGLIYLQQGRSADAARELHKATSLQPNNGEAWALLAGALRESDAPAAVGALQHAVTLAPEQPSLHVQLAALWSQMGESGKAATERKVAADLSRTAMTRERANFALNSGRSLLAEGKLPEAIAQFSLAIETDPRQADPHRLLAEALLRQGKPAEAALERQRADALLHPVASQK